MCASFLSLLTSSSLREQESDGFSAPYCWTYIKMFAGIQTFAGLSHMNIKTVKNC